MKPLFLPARPLLDYWRTYWIPMRVASAISGTLVAFALFALALTTLGWFVPRFLSFSGSPYLRLLPPLAILAVAAARLLPYFRRKNIPN